MTSTIVPNLRSLLAQIRSATLTRPQAAKCRTRGNRAWSRGYRPLLNSCSSWEDGVEEYAIRSR